MIGEIGAARTCTHDTEMLIIPPNNKPALMQQKRYLVSPQETGIEKASPGIASQDHSARLEVWDQWHRLLTGTSRDMSMHLARLLTWYELTGREHQANDKKCSFLALGMKVPL